MSNQRISIMTIVFIFTTLSCSLFQPIGQPSATVESGASVMVDAEQGGELSLPDSAALIIPPGSLSKDAEVTLQKVSTETPIFSVPELISVGDTYEINLGTDSLKVPAILEIPYDRARLPVDSQPDQIFLSYYDEQTNEWVFAGGKVDKDRNVIILPITHASRWNPFTWNWKAWIAVLNKILRASIVEFIEAFALLTDDCLQTGQYVLVDSSNARNVIQGCIERDDQDHPSLRVVNPKSFFLEIRPVSGGNDYPSPVLLSPGEDLDFDAFTTDPSPLVISAEMTQRSGFYLVVHLVLTMMPGANQFGIQGKHVACITERLKDVSHFASAVEALIVDQNGAAAAESLSHFMFDEDAVRRFITASDDCHFGPAKTWSFEGIRQLGGAISTIMSATDYIANYFAGNTYSEIAFNWTPPASKIFEVTQIGSFYTLYLVYDSTEWESFDIFGGQTNNAGEPVNALRHKKIPGCTLQDNLGKGTPDYWRRQDSNRFIGSLEFRVEAWTDTQTDKAVLTVYQYPTNEIGVRIELVIQDRPKLCIENAEEVLILSEDEILKGASGTPPMEVDEIGPNTVWDPPQSAWAEIQECMFADQASSGSRCIVSIMERYGASPEARDFISTYDADYFLISFIETGSVDQGVVFYPTRANDNWQNVLLNGEPLLVFAEELGGIDIKSDPLYPSLINKYSNLTIWPGDNNLESVQPVADGGQRFIFRYPLLNGCHACEVAGFAFVNFDFDAGGLFLGTSLASLRP